MEDIQNPFLEQSNQDSIRETFASPDPPANETPQEKLARLKKREEDLLKRQEDLQQARNAVSHPPNWPRFVPFLYVNIEEDIPSAARGFVKVALVGVVLSFIQVIINLIACISVRGLPKYSIPRTVVFSLIFGILNLYLTVSINFKKLYKACKHHDIPFTYTLLQFVLILFLLYLFVGFPNSGSAGLATFLDLVAKSDSVWAKIIAFINTLALLSCIILQFYILQQSQKYQKISGVEPLIVN